MEANGMEGLLIAALLVTIVVGLLLSAVPGAVDYLLRRRHLRLRRAVRVGFAIAYVAIGIWAFGVAGSEYTRELAEVHPEGDCRGWGEDNSGCPASDGRPLWIIFWGAVGLVGFGISLSTRAAEPDHELLADVAH